MLAEHDRVIETELAASHGRVSSEDSTEGGWQVVGRKGGPGPVFTESSVPPSPLGSSKSLPPRGRFGPLCDEQGTAVEVGDGRWTGTYVRRRRLRGKAESHARFLQYYFRRSTTVRPGCWRRGGMHGLVLFRPPTVFSCGGGLNLASPEAFADQARVAREVIDWYANYIRLHRRYHSMRTPTALVTFCGEGGVSEGVRRAGGAAHGQDLRHKERYCARFGRETFTQGDSCSPHELRRLKKRSGAFFTVASPPCKAHSSSLMRGEASEPALIKPTRSALGEIGGLTAIENVVGAGDELRDPALLRGAYFGLHVDRPRKFECNFDFHIDRALREGGDRLRRGTCLGHRRRWRRLDHFGRPEMMDCCGGNLWAVQGDKPYRCTPCECAAAMGIDSGHMSYEGMSQAVPPVYGELLFAQACMRDLEREFGVEAITFDEYSRNPESARRRMAHLLEGAGGASPDRGVEFSRATKDRRGLRSSDVEHVAPPSGRPEYRAVFEGRHAGGEIAPASEATVREAELRELEYSWAGFYDRATVPDDDRSTAADMGWDLSPGILESGNTLLLSLDLRRTMKAAALAARLASSAPGTRVTIEARCASVEACLRARGFRFVRRVRRGSAAYASSSSPASLRRGSSFWSVGEEHEPGGSAVDYSALHPSMDPLDVPGAPQEPRSAKVARSFMPIKHEPRRWDIGLPSELNAMMAGEGVHIHAWREPGFSEVPFYPFASDEGLMRSIQEADRALAVGAMEYVPEASVDEVMSSSTIHPWTIVDQGGGKWRLCHDYSVGTNRIVATAPFTLPSVWDAVASVKSGSCFAKYDIRDGFWHCPVAPDSRKRLVVRHPGTGRLMWASRLPFGYLDSPRLFCGLTEAIAERLRKRAAGRGIHFFVFVDDYLCIGDTEELTREGMQMLEAEFAALGVQWAPHKRRGPCQAIEFLGLLLSNVPGAEGVTLSQKRLESMESLIRDWLSREVPDESVEADPREVAQLLGKLVFASQVVSGGRTYLQNMLSVFKGMVVDWRRGKVTYGGAKGQSLHLGAGFWRDLRWWRRHLAGHALAPLSRLRSGGDLVIAGTDASDWGTGQVIWRDGGREEYRLVFTIAERRRPINWRELLGIVRVCQIGGERLRGKVVMIEADNTTAVAASANMSSKAEDMQELVRRLLRLSRRYGFELRVTHTPGEKLDRPDQTSRGDAVEEPRARLSFDTFSKVSSAFGPFSDMIGAEREHGLGSPEGDERRCLWAHPTFNTVGSALRRIGEQLEGGSSTRTRALALVPKPQGERWSTMLRHGTVVGSFEAGDEGLELNVLGRWQPTRFRRPMLLVLFPRPAGEATPRKLQLSLREGLASTSSGSSRAAGYEFADDGASFHLVVVPGSYVYSLPGPGHEMGELSKVRSVASGEGAGRRSGEITVSGLELATAAVARRLAAQHGGPGWVPLDLTKGAEVHRMQLSDLWLVDEFVRPVAGGRTFDRVIFNRALANDSIRALEAQMPRADTHGWDLGVSSDDESTPALGGGAGSYEQYVHVSPPGGEAGSSSDLANVVKSIDDLALRVSPVNRGSEGKVPAPPERVRGGETLGQVAPGVVQKCPYSGMTCVGCGGVIGRDELMVTYLSGVIHHDSLETCRELADADRKRRLEAEAAAAREPARFFALFSLEPGASGIYGSASDASRWLGTSKGLEHARLQECESESAGHEFIRACSHEHAASTLLLAGDASRGGVKGSSTQRVQTIEGFHPQRMARIDKCMAGQCGLVHDCSNSSVCLGGCGRRLHLVSCAGVGAGFAALGNFTCPECRMDRMVPIGEERNDRTYALCARTMLLEMTQGSESTSASYADYEKLEEEFVTTHSSRPEGGGILLPRHSEESFKNFVSWMALDRDRARSLESVVRSAGSFFCKVGIVDLTKLGGVKAHLAKTLHDVAMEHEPSTAATPLMLSLMVGDGGEIDLQYRNPFLRARSKVQHEAEGVGGCRIGEVVGGGETHGVLANESSILWDPETEREVVEMKIEHSKTGYSRYLDYAGRTQTSGIACADHLRELWRLSGFHVETVWSAGIRVTRPDFWVVRVRLTDMAALNELHVCLSNSDDPLVRNSAPTAYQKAKERVNITGAHMMSKKYVNVRGGRRADPGLDALKARLEQKGFVVTIVPGPLLLATTGGANGRGTLMPLSVSTALGNTKSLLEKSALRASRMVGGDPELEVSYGRPAHWTSHSLRRLADTVARKFQKANEVTDEEIDLYFGWHEAILLKEMRRHYSAQQVRSRMQQARITGRL